jgi:parallel beta-helix repeat protein
MYLKSLIHILAIALFWPTLSFSATFYVGEGETYTTIQSAVDAANDGDEVIVKDGEYIENIGVNKTVSICSESGYTATTVVAKNSSDNIFYVTADKVRIEGFSLYGVTASYNYGAIHLYYANQCIIANNLCGVNKNQKNNKAIYLEYSHKNSINNNNCFYNYNAIRLHDSANNTIMQNTIMYNYEGIYLNEDNNNRNYSNIIILNKLLYNKDNGLYLEGSNNIITQNIMAYNEEYGLYLDSPCIQNYIYNNSFVENQLNAIKSNILNQNFWKSPTPIVYSYEGNQFKSYLGNFYSDHDPSGEFENGISEHMYKYPYVEPCDEYPLLQQHDQYVILTETLYPDSNSQLSSLIQPSEIHIGRGRSLMWTESQAVQTETSYPDFDAWKGQIHLRQALKSNSILKIEIGSSSNQYDFIPGGPEIEILGDDSSKIIEFETSSNAFSVKSNHYLAFRVTNLSGVEYDIVIDEFTYILKPADRSFQPSVYSVQPGIGGINGGTEVTIKGSDFGNQQGNGQVTFGGIPASQIKEWSSTKIVCVSPAHVRDLVTIEVISDNQSTGSKKKAFMYSDQNICYVGPEEPITCIQDAIYAASDGLTIVVRDGHYSENIVVNKPLTILSENGWESTTIEARDSNTHVVNIIANNVTIQGFSIYGAKGYDMAGINVMADHCKILNNVCGVNQDQKNTYGIQLKKIYGSSYRQLSHNIVSGNQCFYSSGYGICCYYVNNSIVQNNRSSFNSIDGLYFSESDVNIINNNVFSHNKQSGIYFSFSSEQNIISENLFEQNQEYGLFLYGSNNIVYHNSFIDNQTLSVGSNNSSHNKWFSPAPIYYEYNGHSYKNYIGNYFSDHFLSDTDQNGITDDNYALPYKQSMDKYPLSMPKEHYTTQLWHLTESHLLENQIVFNDTSVSIDRGRSYMWTTPLPLATDLAFSQANVWSGQLCLTSTPSQNTMFKIDIGVSENGMDFVSYGETEILAFEKGATIPFVCHVSDFTLPKRHYVALRITNLSGSEYTIKTGSFNTFISKPATRNLPDIFQIEPENCSTSGNAQVIITGSGFGSQQGDQEVMFGEIKAISYESWTPTQIVCTAPAHMAGRLNVWVKKDEQNISASGFIEPFIFKDDTLIVGKDKMYPSIQSAVNEANYSDTIIVHDGVYKENIYIDKPLTIRSVNGYEATTIYPTDSSPVVSMQYDNCIFDGFTICHPSSYGLQVNSNYCIISNNHISMEDQETSQTGIYLTSAYYTLIKNNLIDYNYTGIYLDSSDGNKIINNECSYNNYGIATSSTSENNIISTNSCQYNNNDGINVYGRLNVIYANQSTSNGEDGIEVGTGLNLVIQNDVQTNAEKGISSYGESNIIFYNTIQYNNENASLTKESTCFNSPIQLYYTYNDQLLFNYIGNKFAPFFSSDKNGDGIYDESYFIPENSNDSYPLYQTPDAYNLQIWTLLPDSRMVKQFTDESGQITIEPNGTHIWKAGADAIKLTGTSQWTGQVITGNSIPDGHYLTIVAGYVDKENTFIPAGSASLITGDGSEKYFTTQGSITPLADKSEKALAIQIENNSTETINILTGGAWSFFSFGQGDSNQPPVAEDDTYTLSKGQSITIDAPGILNNDSDPENKPLTLFLVQNVSHGTLTLNPNGSFTYAHDGSDMPSDRFTYKVNDGSMDSFQHATVTLKILQAPTITFSPSKPISNTPYQVSISSSGSWIEYQTDEVNWQRYTTSFEISNEGTHTIQARVKNTDDDWIDAIPVTFTIDKTPPGPPQNMMSQPEQNTCGGNTIHIQWDPATDHETNIAGYSILFDMQKESTPDNQIDITTMSWFDDSLVSGNEYYFHIVSVDTAGNVSAPIHLGSFCVNQSYEIQASAGNHGRIIPQGTLIVQKGDNQGFQFKPDTGYTIDQIFIDNEPIQQIIPEYVFNNINGNHSIEVTFKYTGPLPPENVTVISEATGVQIKWIDKTIKNEVAGYQVYRSKFQSGPFLLIDPVALSREVIGEDIWYQVFDTFDPLDIQRKSTFWYGISAIMSDGSISRLSVPVSGQAQVIEGGLFHLIPVQQELEAKPGESVTFNIYVIAEGDFQDWVELEATYPSSQSKPDSVSWEFTEDRVKPLASLALKIKFGHNAKQGTYDIDISATGGERSDVVRLRFSIVYEDAENGFISAHIKQKMDRVSELTDINGQISVRKNDWIDIYGRIIPSTKDMPVDVIIQHEDQPYTSLHTTSQTEGEYLQSFSPEHVGTYKIHAQYVNQQNKTVKSQDIIFSVRKNNQSSLRCNTGDQDIETGEVVSIYSYLYPEIEDIPIHFQVKEPDNTISSLLCKTDSQGECDINISLSKTGIWEIQAWWEGNLDYEGQYSKPLYLYPGIESPRALILAGGGIQDNALCETTHYLADRFYKLLISRNMNNDLIHYMSSVTNELNGRIDDINPSEQSVTNYLMSLYQDGPPYLVDEKTPFIIYMVDHGGKNLFKINKKEFLSADVLNHSLDLLQQKTNCEIQIIMDACYAGSFIDDLSHENSQKRIIMTATGENAPAYYDQGGRESFSSHLFNYLIQGFSLGDCYSHAREKLWEKAYLYKNQIPQINDINIATKTYLGGTFIMGNYMPEFVNRTPNQILLDRTLTINATVVDIEDEVCTVWASILPPNHHVPSFDDFSSPQWQLETINLTPKPDHENVYEATYNCFYQKGVYIVNIYAQDSAGNVSSEELLVTVKKNQLPPGWGHMDDNDVIDLRDAIIALKVLSKMPLSTLDMEENFCHLKVSLEEVIFILRVMVD